MGSLKPDTTYIYEHADGITYAREFGAAASARVPIGWDYKPEKPITTSTVFGVPVSEISIYIEMMEAAKTNPALQDALERAKLIYHLGKDDAK